MKKKKKLQLSIGVLLGVLVGVLTLFALLIVGFLWMCFGGPPEVTTDIVKYEETMTKYTNVQTGFITFPEKIPDSATNVDFYYFFQDTFDDPTCEVFLQCTYDEADYQAEIERLENTKKQYGSTKRYLMKGEEERYGYPAYVASDGHCFEFEYVLISGERELTYIFTSVVNENELDKIEEKYLPSDYATKLETTDDLWEHYTIYLIGQEKILDSSVWSYDYTRDEVVMVEMNHPISVDYNYFRVCTYLDENDNEVIRYCEYNYYESEKASYDSLPETITFTELNGYRFKNVELSRDMTTAIVTYYDGDEEKNMEYKIPDV